MTIDRQGDSTTELAVAELIESGEIKRHARKVVKVYEQRRDLFADLLRARLGSSIEFDVPDGGLAFWVRFSAGIDEMKLVADANRHHVRFLPGSCFAMDSGNVSGARLGFASLDDSELVQAVERLHRAIAQQTGAVQATR